MTSAPFGTKRRNNPDFNVIMEECMNDLPQKWKLAVTSKYLSEKNRSHLSGIRTTQIVHRSKLLLKNVWN
jgi:RNA polymerase sigma-70 factor (ECF subfamily)